MSSAWVGCAMHGVGCMGVWIYGVFMELNVTTKCDRCYISMQGVSHKRCVMLLGVVGMVMGFEGHGQARCVSAPM